jgi:murein L,D-transpeptidase YcbB/YkuD
MEVDKAIRDNVIARARFRSQHRSRRDRRCGAERRRDADSTRAELRPGARDRKNCPPSSLMLHRVLVFSAALAAAACGHAPPRAPDSPTPTIAEPSWSGEAVEALVTLAAAARADGLSSYESAAAEIVELRAGSTTSTAGAAAFDSAADTLFLELARAFSQGAVDPARVDPDWRIPRAGAADVWSSLPRARDDAAVVRALAALLPQSGEYAALRAELGRVLAAPPGTVDQNGRMREDRIVSLRASLERWRWLPRELPTPRIEVRIAQFRAILHQTEGTPRIHNVIVGARGTQTPTFAAEINAITLNPTWTPPRSILSNELLPQFARDPSAASRGGYDAIDAAGAIVDPATIDWTMRPFPYQVRQRAGPLNALGRVKFELPNPYDIYLHDTPNQALFAREQRALSHGCVRVDDALDLAAAVLAPAYSASSLQAEVDTGQTRSLPLGPPLPVYILYVTASSIDGAVVYADDVYERDGAVISALDAPGSYAITTGFTPSVSECANSR